MADFIGSIDTKAYDEAAQLFMQKTRTKENVGSLKLWAEICPNAIHLDYTMAVAILDRCGYLHSQSIIIPLLCHVLRCHCCGWRMYCRKCHFRRESSSVDLHAHNCICYKVDTYISTICSVNGYPSPSIAISKNNSENEIYISTNILLHVIPQLMILTINYELIDSEYADYLVKKCGQSLKKAEKYINDHGFTNVNIYAISAGSPEFNNVIDKLMEQPVSCMICNQYYDSFPDPIEVAHHLSRHLRCVLLRNNRI